MTKPPIVSRGLCALVVGLLAGCRVGPDYQPPELEMPDAWQQELEHGEFQDGADLSQWWKLLQDPVLDQLIELAAKSNLDLRITMARIWEARARLFVAAGAQTFDVDGIGGYNRLRASENNPLLPSFIGGEDRSAFVLGTDASWEIDVWGRVGRTIEAAGTAYQASVEDHRDVAVTLFAEIALAYVQLRALQERFAVTEANAQTQRQSLALAQSRRDAGDAPELDVAQAETNVAKTEAAIPPLDKAIVLTMNRLATLLGQHPGQLRDRLVERKPVPTPPDRAILGIPANLLRQRPDIRAAERRLASQTALVGVATAELYPNFALTGSIGWTGDHLDEWLTAPSRFWSVGPTFRWNLFDGGRVRNQIQAQDARTREALVSYEKAVLDALEEVEARLTGFVQARLEFAALERAAASARRAASLSVDLYRSGTRDYQAVLDSQRELLVFEDRLASARGSATQEMIGIYKALGGGWQQPKTQETEKPADQETESR